MKSAAVLCACSLALAAGAAGAQSLTMYGLVDVGVAVIDVKNLPSSTRVVSGLQNTSRWGFRGSEPLGGGLAAIYTIEGGFFADTGELGQGGRIFGRQVWAGLQTPLGALTAGRQYLFGAELAELVSPFGVDFLDGGIGNAASSSASPLMTRADNLVMYRSPAVAGGLVGVVGWSFQRDLQEVAPSDNNASMFTGGVYWRSESLYAGVSLETMRCPANTRVTLAATCNASTQKTQSTWQAGAVWSLGRFKLHGLYGVDRDQYFGSTVSNSADAHGLMLGASAQLAGGDLKFSWQQRNDRTAADADLRILGLGYQYPLSVRTALAAMVSWSDNVNNLSSLALRERVSYGAGLRTRF